MTLQEAYKELGGDYADALTRVNENMLLKLVSIFLRDTNYKDICTALAQQDYETAFRGAHTLKGVALNLGLTRLAEKSAVLTEALRARQDNINIKPAFAEFEQAYLAVQTTFSKLLNL